MRNARYVITTEKYSATSNKEINSLKNRKQMNAKVLISSYSGWSI